MKKDDLTQVKYVGVARMKIFNKSGITTIKQLHDTPVEKLAQIKGLSEHYAKLIKDAVTELYGKKPAKPAPKTKAAAVRKKKIGNVNQDLQKQLGILKKRLKQVNENLKPLGKKKYVPSYLDLKKRSKTLRSRLKAFDQKQADLSNKEKKRVIKIAGALNSTLKNAGKKPKMKIYKKLIKEIQSFSKTLK
jgi:ABC-type phosphate transport system auxiliary subunit